MGGLTAFLALLGGTWFPIDSGFMYDIARCLPSYWLVQASHVSLGGAVERNRLGVDVAWTVGPHVVARYVFQRDTSRV